MPSSPPKNTRLLRLFTGPCIISLTGLILSGFTASAHHFHGVVLEVLIPFQTLAGTWLLIDPALLIAHTQRRRGS
jgi:hypothetical protein